MLQLVWFRGKRHAEQESSDSSAVGKRETDPEEASLPNTAAEVNWATKDRTRKAAPAGTGQCVGRIVNERQVQSQSSEAGRKEGQAHLKPGRYQRV